MTYQLVVIFAEDPSDAQALEHLIRYLTPNIGKIRKPRRPLVLMKGPPRREIRSNATDIANAVVREAKLSGRPVDLVIAHQDCDAVEPAHCELSKRIVDELRTLGVPNPVAAAPAWEIEAWWYLWPEAVAAVCPSWRRLTFVGAVGKLSNIKERLRRDLRPSGRGRIPDYDGAFAPRIAEEICKQGKPPKTNVHSSSYEAFQAAVVSPRRKSS